MHSLNTILIHGGIDGDERTGAVNIPVYQTSTYKQIRLGENTGYEYSRTGNPTREALEKLTAELEQGRYGLAFASGMAAIAAVFTLFSSGDKILISKNVYGGTFRILDKIFVNFGITYQFVDTGDIAEIEKNLTKEVKAVLVETPTNPLLEVTDIAAVAETAKKHGVLTIVDNTFMSPYLQRPLTLGADIVLHSATKYLGGHSDLIAGIVVVDQEELAQKLYFIQNSTGGVLGPNDSFLLIRGIKTLGVRMERHQQNAGKIAEWLKTKNWVKEVYYPGLPEHPGYKIQNRQADGAGGMLTFELKKKYDYRIFINSLKIITLAESLGGVESLICQPASMTHASIPPKIRERIGITENLLRLSVGIEDYEDLLADIKQAAEKAEA
nr:PLP-dependent aspartate aminotransferase family protein [Pectinatus haikarae]